MTQDVLPQPDHKALRDEFDELNRHLRQHNEKKIELKAEVYTTYLRRSLEIMHMLNHTTAGPKKATSRAKKPVRDATPLSLSDL